MPEAGKSIKELRSKVTEIVETLDGAFTQLKQQLEVEAGKDKDHNIEVQAPKTKEGVSNTWEPGTYQRIIETVTLANTARNDDPVIYWLDLHVPSDDSTTNTNTVVQLVETHSEAKRLQVLRYNLYALQLFERNNISDFTQIDQNLLLPPVGAVYAIRMSEYITPERIRSGVGQIRDLILQTQKIGLEAF